MPIRQSCAVTEAENHTFSIDTGDGLNDNGCIPHPEKLEDRLGARVLGWPDLKASLA
jgi:hypothetical protein